MDGDQHGWPKFGNQAELQASPWGEYFRLVYGEVPSNNYPICTYSQILLYKPHLDTAGVTPPTSFESGCPGAGDAGQWYDTMTWASTEPAWSNWIWNPDLSMPLSQGTGLPSNTWVEVHHKKFGMDNAATWLYYAPGTAIWLQLGNTKSYPDHPDATQALGIPGCTDKNCIPQFPDLYKAMQAKGLNTIQFLKHADMHCGNAAIEIVDVAGPGGYVCGQTASGTTHYKAGWGPAHDCNCDNSASDLILNCEGVGIRSR